MKLTSVILSVLTCTFNSIFSQTIYSSGEITIAENTQVTVSGDLYNSGLLSSAGSITIDGNWFNNGDYIDNNSYVVLDGTGTQTVDHNGYSFGTLRIEGGDKNIESNFVIENELQLNQGLVNPMPYVQIIVSSEAVISGASEYSFVNGPLTREGTGDHFYPIGKNRNYLPAELLDITGYDPVITMEVFEPNPDPGSVEGMLWVSDKRYWQRTLESGELESAYITLHYLNEDLIAVPENLVVAESNTQQRVFESLGGRNIEGTRNEGSVTSRNMISGEIFTIAELDDLINICNVITPNNDEVNDYLHIANIEEFPDNEVIIINRMGNKVYSAKSYQNDWDASVDGKKLPNGHYICIVKIEGYPSTFRQIITVLN